MKDLLFTENDAESQASSNACSDNEQKEAILTQCYLIIASGSVFIKGS